MMWHQILVGELGAVMDIDKDTYISAEDSHQSNNNELKFYTFGDERMIIKPDGKIGINRSNPNAFRYRYKRCY